jgi:hypothetical protein
MTFNYKFDLLACDCKNQKLCKKHSKFIQISPYLRILPYTDLKALKSKMEVRISVEDQIDEVASIVNNNCKHNSWCNTRLQYETNATELGLKTPLWFKLLLKMPELPSIVYLPAILGFLSYILLPTAIILGYLLAILYVVLIVPFPWIYLCFAGIVLPLLIVSLSVKAHAFWNYWEYMLARKGVQRVNLEQEIEDYVALIKGKQNP